VRFLPKIIILMLIFLGFKASVPTSAPISTLELKSNRSVASAHKTAAQESFSPANFFKEQSCRTLFSFSPPAWVLQNSPESIFKNPLNWTPVCSPLQFEQIRSGLALDPKDLVLRVEAELKNRDECAIPERSRFSSEHVIPSQNSAHLTLMSEDEKTNQLSQAQILLNQVSETCCGLDRTCERMMKGVSIHFCQAQSDPNGPDECIGTGTGYQAEADPALWKYTKENAFAAKPKQIRSEDFHLPSGSITISPFKNDDSPSDFSHEMGHACSWVKRSLAITRGSRAETKEYATYDDCQIDQNASLTYQRLFLSLGLNQASISCIQKRANEITDWRFEKGECANACPRSALDETFADTMSVLSAPASQWVSDKIPEFVCAADRDSRHLLRNDIFRCLLQTPSFLEKAERGTGCKP
jgi:hypothetical protein